MGLSNQTHTHAWGPGLPTQRGQGGCTSLCVSVLQHLSRITRKETNYVSHSGVFRGTGTSS